MDQAPKALADLERFLTRDGSINHRKVRRSMGNRKSRKASKRKGVESNRVKLSEKKSVVKQYLAVRGKSL